VRQCFRLFRLWAAGLAAIKGVVEGQAADLAVVVVVSQVLREDLEQRVKGTAVATAKLQHNHTGLVVAVALAQRVEVLQELQRGLGVMVQLQPSRDLLLLMLVVAAGVLL
jgi:hypothetical protein